MKIHIFHFSVIFLIGIFTSIAFLSPIPEVNAVLTFETYSSSSGFTIDYPSQWIVDNSVLDLEDRIGMVGFISNSDNFKSAIGVFHWPDRDWSKMFKEGILDELQQEAQKECNQFNLNTNGMGCKNQTILGADVMITDDGKVFYGIVHQYSQETPDETFTFNVGKYFFPYGSEVWEITFITEVGDEIANDAQTIVNSFVLIDSELTIPSETIKPEIELDITNNSISSSQVDATVLIYMVASDLESAPFPYGYAATNDINEMMKASLENPNLNIIIQTGGADAKPDGYRFLDFTENSRIKITSDSYEIIEVIGKKNMVDPKTLSDFLIWGTENYPAKKFHLIMWDHGAGQYYGYDEFFNDDSLELDELSEAFTIAKLANPNLHFETIGFDACLMADFDIAVALSPFGNYLVASEELESGDGWDYTAILNSLNHSPNQSGDKLGKVIADSFFVHAENLYGEKDGLETLSVIKLSEIDSLQSSINSLDELLGTLMTSENMPDLLQAVVSSERYTADGFQSDTTHSDLKHLVKNIGIQFPTTQSLTDNIEELIEKTVVYNVNIYTRPNANGISYFWPFDDTSSSSVSSGRALSSITSDYLSNDSTIPELSVHVVGLSLVGKFDPKDVASLSLRIAELPEWDSNDGGQEFLSNVEYNPYDFVNGEFIIDWDGSLPYFVSYGKFFLSSSPEYVYDDDVTLAYVPILLESKNLGSTEPPKCRGLGMSQEGIDCRQDSETGPLSATMIVDVSEKKLDQELKILKVWPDDPNDSVISRTSYQLQYGDVIWPIVNMYNFVEDYWYLPHTYSNLEFDENFRYQYMIRGGTDGPLWAQLFACDYSGNCSTSEPFEYTFTCNELGCTVSGLSQYVPDFKNTPPLENTLQPLQNENLDETGGCLIATATYGSELAPQVQLLREIRDNSLLQTVSGTNFMNYFNDVYYSFSPYIADMERENPAFKEVVKIAITPMITSLSILNYVDMDSESSVLGYGISLILLNAGMYFVAPAIMIYKLQNKIIRK